MTRVGLALAIWSIDAVHMQAQQAAEVRLDAPSPVLMVSIARSGGVVAGVSADHKLRIWDTRTKRVSHTLDVAGRDVAWTAISDDGRLVLMADYAARTTVWNSATGRLEWDFKTPHYLTAGTFSRDGKTFAAVPGNPIQLYDVGSHRLLRALESTTGTTSVAFSRDGALLGSTDGEGVRIHDVRSGKLLAKNEEFTSEPLAVEFSTDGKLLLAGGGDRIVILIDATTGTTLHRSAAVADPVFYLEASPKTGVVAVVTQNADDPQRPAAVALIDVASAATKSRWMPPAGVVLPGATWTSDGHFVLVTQTNGALHVWTVPF